MGWNPIKDVRRAFKKVRKEVQRTWSHTLGLEGNPYSAGGMVEGLYKTSPGYYIGREIGKVFNPKMPTLTIPPMPPSTITVGYVSEAEKRRRHRRRGYGSSLITSELGVASTQRKQIFG